VVIESTASVWFPLKACVQDSDCHDGDVCTLQACVEGSCDVTRVDDDCGSTLQTLLENLSPHAYLSIVQKDRRESQFDFEDLLLSLGTISPASDRYLSPVAVTDMGFSFLFYGNLVNEVNIYPNGVIGLPPFLPCYNVIGSIEVRTTHDIPSH
jgi:hypothetical protein